MAEQQEPKRPDDGLRLPNGDPIPKGYSGPTNNRFIDCGWCGFEFVDRDEYERRMKEKKKNG